VVFFTGEYNPNTGVLEPKAFFPRWILPGLALQLLVNPKMESVSEVVAIVIDGLLYYGPVRVLRWIVALFYPVLLWASGLVRRLWYQNAVAQNSLVQASSTQVLS